MTVEIDWNKVAQAGSDALAKSFGAAVGGPLGTAFGQALAGALFGDDQDDQLKQEILTSLGKIEAKLDEVIKFIYMIPVLVKRAVDEGFVAHDLKELRGEAVEVQALLATLRARGSDVSKADFDALVAAGNVCFKKGLTILENGQEWYLSGVHSFTAGLVAYIPAINHDRAYAAGLAVFANELARKMTEFSNPVLNKAQTFTLELANLQAQLTQSSLIRQYVTAGTSPNFLLSWEPSPDGKNAIGFACWTAIYADNHVQGDTLFAGHVDITVADHDVSVVTKFGAKGFKAAPWFPPIKGPARIGRYNEFQATIGAAVITSAEAPPKIEHLINDLATIASFMEALYAFGSLAPKIERQPPT